jgi:hypothetical protein
MPGVFISYRREDSSAWAGRLFDILSAHFGRRNTFMDLDGIEGGDDFVTVIEDKLKISDVLVAVIGSHWLVAADASGSRRLDNPKDFVRLEIGKALERGIRVIPVLVNGAAMPRAEDLPGNLRELSERQAVEVRDTHFHQDAEQLVEVLHRTLHGTGLRGVMTSNGRMVAALVAGLAAIVVVIGVLLFRHATPEANGGSSAAVVEPTAAINAEGGATHPSNGGAQTGRVAASAGKTAQAGGNWTATVKYDWGDSHAEMFHFEMDGDEVSGTASFLGAERGILDGKIVGNRISFMTKSLTSLNSDDKTYEDKHYYKGTIENDAIRFTMMTDSSIESHVPIQFVASRTSAR